MYYLLLILLIILNIEGCFHKINTPKEPNIGYGVSVSEEQMKQNNIEKENREQAIKQIIKEARNKGEIMFIIQESLSNFTIFSSLIDDYETACNRRKSYQQCKKYIFTLYFYKKTNIYFFTENEFRDYLKDCDIVRKKSLSFKFSFS
jgi:hypothetical protein